MTGKMSAVRHKNVTLSLHLTHESVLSEVHITAPEIEHFHFTQVMHLETLVSLLLWQQTTVYLTFG